MGRQISWIIASLSSPCTLSCVTSSISSIPAPRGCHQQQQQRPTQRHHIFSDGHQQNHSRRTTSQISQSPSSIRFCQTELSLDSQISLSSTHSVRQEQDYCNNSTTSSAATSFLCLEVTQQDITRYQSLFVSVLV